MSGGLTAALSFRALILVAFLFAGVIFGIARARSQIAHAVGLPHAPGQSGLSAVRLTGSRQVLEDMRAAAADVGWTESSYDTNGGLVLPVPANYTNDDFGRLLKAIDPYKSVIGGLQMLGPNGGTVDDQGVERFDE